MPNYQDGKIYKLVGYGLTYIGSTTQPLSKRKVQHKSAKHYNAACRSCLLFAHGDDVDIVLLEKYPCADKEELNARERHWIETTECVNKTIPGRTDKEYRDAHKDHYKQWRTNNKEVLKEKKKTYYENVVKVQRTPEFYEQKKNEKVHCVCGSVVRKNEYSRHCQSKKHKSFINI